jgi:hypothetical protein
VAPLVGSPEWLSKIPVLRQEQRQGHNTLSRGPLLSEFAKQRSTPGPVTYDLSSGGTLGLTGRILRPLSESQEWGAWAGAVKRVKRSSPGEAPVQMWQPKRVVSESPEYDLSRALSRLRRGDHFRIFAAPPVDKYRPTDQLAATVAGIVAATFTSPSVPAPPAPITAAIGNLVRPPLSTHERAEMLVNSWVAEQSYAHDVVSESVTGKAVTQAFGLDHEQLAALSERGQLLVLSIPSGPLFPIWQFDASTADKLVPNLKDVLARLDNRPSDEVIDWLRTPKSRLGGTSPISALRAGEYTAVLELAQAVGAA